MKTKFPFYKQLDAMDCGPTCLRMVAKFYGKNYTLDKLRTLSHITREGVSLLGISDAAEAIGFRTLSVLLDLEKLREEAPLPAILYWRNRHFVVVHKITKHFVYVVDPAYGKLKMTYQEFLNGWTDSVKKEDCEGIALLLEPSPEFENIDDDKGKKTRSLGIVFSYLKPYRKFITQLFLGLVVGSIIQLIFPFLTQAIVDVGIINKEIGFVNIILLAQLIFFISKTASEFIRSWILLHMGSRININMVSDFLMKLMKLPISYFDIKMSGDIIQRVHDHERVESLMTSSSLNTLFSAVNLLIFGAVLAYYNLTVFFVFAGGSLLYTLWITFFLKKRRDLDYKIFDRSTASQNSLLQLIYGMQEIKLNNSETLHRWKWERIRASLFKLGLKGLAVQQYQDIGSGFINELKNILITFIAANAVIHGNMTLGMMMAVLYIIGQLNGPLVQMVNFIRSYQDAKISMERIGEIYEKEDEESNSEQSIRVLPENKTFHLHNVSFRYEGPHSECVLNDVSFDIPQGKVTAIVGPSGSGKTTLLKLLLRFYAPTEGSIKLGHLKVDSLNIKLWRQKCGTVLQDGYIFSDTIAKNIAVSDEKMDIEKLVHAVRIANIKEFIEELPLGYNTKIGSDGHGLSQGQKQRILIARAVYKDPEFMFFDEATNALDANNERVIMQNLERFFKGRTVLIVAHRLSTVKNADQIIVLERGRITEIGSHAELTVLRGSYYHLVKNQLELGN